MTALEQQLVQLIRISITGRPEPFSSKIDWTEMMHFSSNQGVLGVAFGAIEHLLEEDRPHIDFIMDWMRQITYLESINKIHKDVISEIASFLHKHDIRMLLLKGADRLRPHKGRREAPDHERDVEGDGALVLPGPQCRRASGARGICPLQAA